MNFQLFHENSTEEISLIYKLNLFLPLNFHETIENSTEEISLIYKLLKHWDYRLPSYQETRLEFALNKINLTDSPYQVLEQLYYH